MESTNLYHLQHQPQAVDTSSLATPSSYGIGSTHSWSPQLSSNAGNLNQILQEAASGSRDSTLNSCMIQDLGYHQWGSNDAESWLIKEEMCDTFPKCTETLNNSASTREEHYWVLQEEEDHLNGVSEKLLLNTISSSDSYSPTAGGLGAPSRGNFSQIHPTINISSLNHSSPAISTTSSGMNLHSLYPLSSSRFRGDSSLSLHMRHPADRSSTYKSSIPSQFTNAMIETKRPSALMKPKPFQSQTASKRLRPESRSSCPPLKVRKEKLGDRIAALQQLVAPFGKTDTASVLMEAIGYIKFLHNQVETLIVPYMKSSRNQNNRVMQGGSGKDIAWDTPKRDLISRGLCLVPLSCMSYITGDHESTGVWHHPSFDGPS